MALGDRTDGILMNVASAAVQDGHWYSLLPTALNDGRIQLPLIVSLKAGACTIVVEGRNHPSDTPVQITSTTASVVVLATKYRQFRARITAVTTAPTVVATIAAELIDTGA